MSQALAQKPETGVVYAGLNYLVRTDEKPVNETGGTDGLMRKTTGTFARHVMPIHDARPLSGNFTLDSAGFELAAHPTRVKSFLDGDDVRGVYYPEVERLIAAR